MRAALVGMTRLTTLVEQGPQLHRRLADRRRKRPRQVLHTPQTGRPAQHSPKSQHTSAKQTCPLQTAGGNQ
jgi:hypothetical protein